MSIAAPFPTTAIAEPIRQALIDLLRCGYGRVDCAASADALDYAQTELTYRPKEGESDAAFVARLLADPPWRAGDDVSFLAKRDRLDLVRIRRVAPNASDIIVRERGETPGDFATRLEAIARGLRVADQVP